VVWVSTPTNDIVGADQLGMGSP